MNILLLLPATILIVFVFGIPLVRYAWLSIHAYSVITDLNVIPNYGLNWIRLINDHRFWQDAFQTVRFAFFSVSLELLLAICIALILDQKIRNRGLKLCI